MNYYKEVELINKLLSSLPKHHASVKDQMIFERGYLTGLLSRILHEDAGIRAEMIDRLRHLENKKIGGNNKN